MITYQSGGHSTQIDYILIGKKHREVVKDVKAIAGEEIAQQLMLVVGVLCIESPREDKKNLPQVDPIEGPVNVARSKVAKAIKKMKNDKAAVPSGVCAEMLKVAGEVGIDMVYDLINDLMKTGVIPTDCQDSIIITAIKAKVMLQIGGTIGALNCLIT